MSQYIAIAAIRIEHNYYNPPENSFVGLEPTSETKKLMKQRGVMLRQSRGNEWQWIMAMMHRDLQIRMYWNYL